MVHGKVAVPTLPVAVVHRVLLCLEDAGGARLGGVDAKARAHTAAAAATVKLMELSDLVCAYLCRLARQVQLALPRSQSRKAAPLAASDGVLASLPGAQRQHSSGSAG